MNISRPFILRPVATTLLMIAIILAGFVAYNQLAVSALPTVDYPTIQVRTFFPGASPEVMASSVTARLERQFDYHAPIYFGPQPGRRRTAGSGRHQCSLYISSKRSSRSTRL